MGTRCTINFNRGEEIHAKVYRHYDGYPEGVLPDLETFFSDVELQTQDTRFSDPSYLAAKYIDWQAAQNAEDKEFPLAFLSVGVVLSDPGDIEYTYTLQCINGERPGVTYKEIYGEI